MKQFIVRHAHDLCITGLILILALMSLFVVLTIPTP